MAAGYETRAKVGPARPTKFELDRNRQRTLGVILPPAFPPFELAGPGPRLSHSLLVSAELDQLSELTLGRLAPGSASQTPVWPQDLALAGAINASCHPVSAMR